MHQASLDWICCSVYFDTYIYLTNKYRKLHIFVTLYFTKLRKLFEFNLSHKKNDSWSLAHSQGYRLLIHLLHLVSKWNWQFPKHRYEY